MTDGVHLVAVRFDRFPALGTFDTSVTISNGALQHSLRHTGRDRAPCTPLERGAVSLLAPAPNGVGNLRVADADVGIMIDLELTSSSLTADLDPAVPLGSGTTVGATGTVVVDAVELPTTDLVGTWRHRLGRVERHAGHGDAAPPEQLPRSARLGLALLGDPAVLVIVRQETDRITSTHLAAPPCTAPPDGASFQIDWHPGSRWPRRIELTLLDGTTTEVRTLDVSCLALKAGLADPSAGWPLGAWRGSVTSRQDWTLGSLDPTDIHHVPVIAALTDEVGGIGLIDLSVIGDHDRWGLTGFSDGAPG
jgi:hypothetical protein